MQEGYETSDAQLRPLIVFGIGLTVLCVLVGIVTRQLESSWNAEVDERSSEHPMEAYRAAPTAPLLQATTAVDLIEHREREDIELGQPDWIDRENGVVRIKIETAMELLLERGLPVRDEGGGQ